MTSDSAQSPVELILIRGLPGSGKSTLAKTYEARGFIHIETDTFFVRDGKYTYDKSKAAEAHAWCQDETRAALAAGTSVVIANTFCTRQEMQPFFAIAADVGIPRPTIVEATGKWKSVHEIPEAVIARMAARWETIDGVITQPNVTSANPLNQTIAWLIEGQRLEDIAEAMRASFPGADQEQLFAAAVDHFANSSRGDLDVVVGWGLEAYRDLYRRMVSIGDFVNAMKAVKEIVALAGKYDVRDKERNEDDTEAGEAIRDVQNGSGETMPDDNPDVLGVE